MQGQEATLSQLTGGPIQAPEWLEAENAERAARIIRAAAKELIELRFPLRALWALWQELLEHGCTIDRLRAIGSRIFRLSRKGLGERERVLLDQLATLTFVGQQAVLVLPGATHDTAPRAGNSQGRGKQPVNTRGC